MPIINRLKQPKNLTCLALSLLVLLTLFVYANSLFGDLLEWDDRQQVSQNLDIRQLDSEHLKKIFSTFYLGMYQPLATLSFAVENKLFNLQTFWLRFDNLWLHLLNLCLVYWLTKRLFNRRLIALITATLFALFPLQVETVAWVSARSNLLSATFILSSLIAFTFYQKKQTPSFYSLTLILFFGSLLAKATGLFLPFILLALDYQQKRRFDKKVWLEKIPFFILALIFGWLATTGRVTTSLLPTADYYWLAKLFILPYPFIFYLSKLILPINLSPYYGFPVLANGWLPPIFYLSFLLWLILLIIVWRWRAQRTLVWLAGFYHLLILPTLPIGNFSAVLAADRYIYLAGLAWWWLFSWLFALALTKFKKAKIYLIAGLLIIVCLLAALSKNQAEIWSDNLSLWRDMVKDNPQSADIYSNAGNAESRRGNLDKALEYYNKALALKPNDAFIYNNIASALAQNNGDKLKAIDYYSQAIKLKSNEALFYYNRGLVEINIKQTKLGCQDLMTADQLGYKEAQEKIKQCQ